MFNLLSIKIVNNNFNRMLGKNFSNLLLHFGPNQTIQTAANTRNSQFMNAISNLFELDTPPGNGRDYGTSASDETGTLIAVSEAKRFVVDCLVSSHTPESHAKQMADLLIEADVRGHFSHGMNRLAMYVNDLHKKSIDGQAEPKILKETVATAWVDGNNALGAVVGNFCMKLAIEKAKICGIGMVSAKYSNHYGIAGWYTTMAQREGLIGMSSTNTSPLMCPTRSKQAALGTNPLSFASPGIGTDAFVLDMATTTVAVGKIEMKKRMQESCPLGWAQDADGQQTTNAEIAYDACCLMPLGGAEETSGFKGYGLGVMVETLCGVLSGSAMSHEIRKWSLDGNDFEANLGQVFLAIDPECFAPGYRERQSKLLDTLRNMPRTDPENPVIVAGDRSRAHKQQVEMEGGIRYIANQITTCNQLAAKLNIPKIQSM